MYEDYSSFSNDDKIEETVEMTEEVVEEEPDQDDGVESKIGHVANCEKVRLRNNPDTVTGVELKILDKGTEVMVIDEVNSYYYVVLASGEEGYIMSKFVAIDE